MGFLLLDMCWGPLMARTWWSRVDDKKVKEGKRLIFPGLYSWPLSSRESVRNRKRGRERKTRGPKLWWSKGVLIHMVWAYILSYKVVILSKIKIKIPDLRNIRWSILGRVVNNHFYHMVHKKEEDTYHRIEKLMKEKPTFLSPGKSLPLLLILEYSGINKEQRIDSWQIQNSTQEASC